MTLWGHRLPSLVPAGLAGRGTTAVQAGGTGAARGAQPCPWLCGVWGSHALSLLTLACPHVPGSVFVSLSSLEKGSSG